VNRQDDLGLLRVLLEVTGAGERCALATVVHTRGSTPRKTGTKMLVIPSRGLVGTVGGGCGEAEVLDAARRVLAGGRPEVVTVDLTRDILSWSPAVCGGTMEVFVEAVHPRIRP
jgi:xanthine dehydrogenase accessory factor